MSACPQVSDRARCTLRSAHGKAFTPSESAPEREGFAEWPVVRAGQSLGGGGTRLRRSAPGRAGSLRIWFLGSLTLLAAFFFLLGVNGAEKHLDSAHQTQSAAAGEARLF
ncbi:MAG: hypothetical protein AB7E32_11130 [Desulfovibrio sp.]